MADTLDSATSNSGYASPTDYVQDGAVLLGCSRKGRELIPECIELRLANRHGLVTGATGTGKTVTLQVLAEGFSAAGVPVFAADIKGDLSGIAVRRRRASPSSSAAPRRSASAPASATAPSRWPSGTCSASRAIPCAPPRRRWGRCCCRGCSS